MRPTVVHVIQTLSRGGAARSLLTTAAAASAVESTIVSLLPADRLMTAKAADAGLPVLEALSRASLDAALEAADVVHVHFWNSPELYEFLRAGLPPVRLAVWVHVAGDTPPQVVTPELVEVSDVVVASTPHTAALPVVREPTAVIVAAADTTRLPGVEPKPHPTFNVGYIGTVDFAKMHPRYVDLSASVDVPGVRFVVCGGGNAFATLEAQALRLGAGDRFDFRGYVEDIGQVAAELDVFGYPLAPGNYSTSDLVLQEMMGAGVPPVVLPYGGAHDLVRHGETGLVARDEAEYPRAIEYLHARPEERARLGRNAREHAGRAWRPAESARRWTAIYRDLLGVPKRRRTWPGATASERFRGADAFVESLGGTAPEFAISLAAADEQAAIEAERRIAAAPPVVSSAGGGGVLHYRLHYPDDGYLRLWAGLVLGAESRHVLAAAELKRAYELGCDGPRVLRYLARSAERIGASDLARRALDDSAART